MSMANNETPRRIQSDGLVEQELETELMLFDSARNKAFCLNRTAAFVWKNCDGKTSVAEIASRLSERMHEPAGEEAVLYALNLLESDGLIESVQQGGSLRKTITRRDLLQKIGVGAIPMITVLFIHPAKAHASSIPSSPGAPGTNPPTGLSTGPGSHPHGDGFWQWLIDLFT